MDEDRVQLAVTLYIKEYGSEASNEVGRNVETLNGRGDKVAADGWARIVKEIEKRRRL